MKQPNPLLPQGSFEAQGRSKSQVRLAVFTILVIHVVVLGALLIHGAGCKREDSSALGETNDLSSVPAFASNDPITPGASDIPPTTSNPISPASNPAAPVTGIPPLPSNSPTAIVPPPVPPVDMTPPAAMTEHVIVSGDTFSGLSTKYGVSVPAIQAANPTADPARLRVGQKINIPPKTATATTRTGSATAESANVYVVKSGDTLANISKAHGTTVKAIQKLNNLTTTRINVGQKLKLPPRTTNGTAPAPAPAPSSPAPGGAIPAPAPAQ